MPSAKYQADTTKSSKFIFLFFFLIFWKLAFKYFYLNNFNLDILKDTIKPYNVSVLFLTLFHYGVMSKTK